MEPLFSTFAQRSVKDVASVFNTSLTDGLSAQEVQERQKKYGPNIMRVQKIAWYSLLFKQIYSPFFILFFLLAILSFAFGTHLNALIILIFLLINAVVGFYQEFQAYKDLESLKKYLMGIITVLRDGKEQEISSSELVVGDILVLYPGDILAGDVRLADANNLAIDESALTGESSPVGKMVDALEEPVDLFKAHNIGFAGTTVTSGKGLGIVFAIAQAAMMSGIAQISESTVHESSLSAGAAQLGRFITILIVIATAGIFIGNILFKGFALDYANLLLFSVAMAIAITPEALPIVMTFCLARGVQELAKKKVIVKRLSAVEDLGAMEILCTDKTGTLTENSLQIRDVYGKDPERTLFYAALTTVNKGKALPTIKKGFDYVLWERLTVDAKESLLQYTALAEIPFDPVHRRNNTVVRNHVGDELIVRGSVPDVIALCSAPADAQMNAWITREGEQGNRVLAVAKKSITFKDQESIRTEEHNLELLGFISFADPIKATVIESIQFAKRLGVEIKILSGDVPEVCYAIGKQVGLIESRAQVIMGDDLEKLSGQEKEKAVQESVVFARLSPIQKYEIIQLLQKKKVVGYMGDGINDAPALKIADVSIAVRDAVDVAYKAANIILLQKSLHVLCLGIEEGRKIVTNTLKYLRTALSSNMGNFFSLFVASLALDYLPMLPIQLLLLNLLSDFPMIAISTDTVDRHYLKTPKRYQVQDIFFICIILAIVSSVFDLIFFLTFKNFAPEVLQTGWFVESILTELVFIFCIRVTTFAIFGNRPSWPLGLLAVGSMLLAVILPQMQFAQELFLFTPLAWHHYALIFAIVSVYFCTTELVKVLFYRTLNNHKRERYGKR